MSTFLLAHDIGTTGNKATLFSKDGDVVASTFYGYNTNYPQVGWAEQNPNDWWKAVCHSTKELLQQANVLANEVASISFSAQMQGVVAVDQKGQLLRDAIIWADMRAEDEAKYLSDSLGFDTIYEITGHRISSSYSGAKIVWIKHNEPDIYQKTYKFLHVKDYLIFKLTGKFGTDYTDASGMNLLDLSKKEWSSKIVDAWGIDGEKLPNLYPSTYVIGEVTNTASAETGLQFGTPVVMGGGDGSCAALGAGIVEDGDIFNYIGSSSWIALCSSEPLIDLEMKTFTFAHIDENKYLPCGTMQAAGTSYQWVRDQIYQNVIGNVGGRKNTYDVMNEEAGRSKPGANNLIYLPYLLGERSPWWDPKAKGSFIGLHVTHTREDIARATLEGITMNLKVVLDTFRKYHGHFNDMWLFGGGAKSLLWRQILADIYGVEIHVPKLLDETTSMGAAIAGGVGAGVIKDLSVAKEWVKKDDSHLPNNEHRQLYDELFHIFQDAYKQLAPINHRLSDLHSKRG
ncbi:xylulokinase [Salirhabdus salicampi]|uniref:xylulokinase n=1 Tax=Salirhabdus salicampi TaxID=476102 RepID=UPI003F5A140E